ncbi:MAG: hypothetical protein F6K25_24030 [Okeania sp. SIO2G4]|uniref:hypothetical protein n=1 Tax=unclassified Okeania TaxID=2634635 RepID=UPI0013BC711B|nr:MULTISPECIES: hypothetical protein [unclassified Okeania]NEP38538.1 hypothetical protein [Okeania sp. SIO2H7]NEP74761.1 hypothetical protein [Okeania sp. SIO2G5]NEP95786.1 hypothetical protein [Okeania sp. SIO2F5]NEQ93564.1 hypothetical protein [Okeania sp. SIO2G4]
MVTASKYWRQIKINSSGSRQILEITEAKQFFTSNFPEYITDSEISDINIQRQLLALVQDNSDTNLERNSLLAERCLLCFISWQIDSVCQQLAANFGTNHGFTRENLFPYVLTDDGRISSQKNQTSSCSFAQEILQNFDPNQSNLATWTTRKVKQHPELNSFLLECGVYLISDWAILNDTPPKQLEKIFSVFYNFTAFETRESIDILSSYHAIYRAQRRQKSLSRAGRKCLPPTTEQLEQIAQLIKTKTGKNISPKQVLTKLQDLASQIREYRISVRSGSLPTIPLDTSNHKSLANQICIVQEADSMDEQNEFLSNYRKQFLLSLDDAIAKVTDSWIQLLKKRKNKKMEQFIQGLHLYHCQGKSMTEIAQNVGLKAQYQVTRLLKLKSFRADIKQELLISLRGRILEIAQDYADPKHLKTIDKKIEIALDEQINIVFKEVESEGYNSQSSSKENLFAQRVCKHIDKFSSCNLS